MVLSPFSVQSVGVEREQAAGRLYAGVAEMVFQEAAFHIAKGRKSHAKRPSFRLQKKAFLQSIGYQGVAQAAFSCLARDG